MRSLNRVLHKLICRAPRYVWHLCCTVVFYVLGGILRAVSESYRGVWIIAERGHDARDNGYHFFRYVRENYPDIKAYYIIDKKSADYQKVRVLGNVVNYGGFRHHLLFSVSDYKISTHIFGYSPDILCYNRFLKLGLIRGKLVMLQHGIIANDIEWMFYPRTKLDLFVCGAEPEYRAVKERYGYPEGVVKYLGLCRYDALLKSHREENIILLMPTWRRNICAGSAEEFIKSDYYAAFQGLINNPRLISLLEDMDLRLVFYPHYEVQKFLGEFSSNSGRVVLAPFDEYDVQELLMSSKLLVTDFSSVFFDFAYMNKPVLFYQFDEAEFRRQNYKEGYFDYRDGGFGPVLEDENKLVDEILRAAGRNFAAEDKYLKRMEKFFTLRDGNCRKRNVEAVLSL